MSGAVVPGRNGKSPNYAYQRGRKPTESQAKDAAWQRGLPIEQLRALATPFAHAHKHLVFGAFGLIKERDVAAALADHRVLWTGRPPTAAMLFHPLSQASSHTDFTGRRIALAAPSIFAHALAADSTEDAVKLLAALAARAPQARRYLEIFEEDAVARAAAALTGYRYMTTKIAAGSEIKGLYVHGDAPGPAALPAEEHPALAILDPAFLSADDRAAILDELSAPAPWAQHYSSYNKRHTWTSFALRGYDDDPAFIIKPSEMSQNWKTENAARLNDKPRWTPAAERYPLTMARLARMGWQFDRVRFMRLAAKGGELTRHADITDRDAGLADGRIARLHVPIITSDAVTFHGWDARGVHMTTHWPAGCLAYLDQRKPHAVTNADPALDRVHLVIDVVADSRLRGMIRA